MVTVSPSTITIRIILKALMPILIGGMIYILYRPMTLRMFSWFDFFGLTGVIHELRQAIPAADKVPHFLIFSLPDALWTYSLINSSLILWVKDHSRNFFLWIFTTISIGFFSEIGQLLDIVPGTFDWTDLSFIGAAVVLAFVHPTTMHHLKHS